MFIFFITICVIFFAYCMQFRKYYLSLKLPGLFPFPLIGSSFYFFNKNALECFEIIGKFNRTYGGVLGFWAFSEFHVLLSDLTAVEAILCNPKCVEKATTYKFFEPWFKEGLVTSKRSKWIQRRKILNPAFHFKTLEQFVETFDRQGRVLVEELSKYDQNDEVEMFPLVSLYTLDVVCETTMGVQINAQRNSNSDYVLAVKKMEHIIHSRMASMFLRFDFIFRFTKLYKEEQGALKTLHDFAEKVIEKRRSSILSEASRSYESKDSFEDVGVKSKIALLDILLQSTINGKPLSNLDIREEVDTFMFGGHDTTTSAITFCLYCIAKHSDVQRRCFEEIKDVLGDDPTTTASLKDLNNLNYLDLVIKETLRMFPSIPLIGRELQEEMVIGDYTYPKGTNVGISIYLIGRDPKLFKDPEEFRPERFSAETSEERVSPYSYIPFSAGPRNCIGQKYAVIEIKTLVSMILWRYEISLAANSREQPNVFAEVTLTSKSKIYFHVNPR